ncbi:MAG: TRAP-type transport system periplasmic protein [Thermoanaerobacteraceae bacterium]|nr:TRAP-type transport system periplasmic protein [Thermoanaerobacteraceae bacterium]
MKILKRLLVVMMVVVMAVSAAGCGGSKTKGDSGTNEDTKGKVYNWKLGTIYNDPVGRPDFNSFGQTAKKFVDLVNEKSGGRIVIKAYYGSVLGASGELFEQLRRGVLEVFYGQPMATVDPRFGVWSVPYIFSDTEQVKKLMANPEGPLFKMFQEWMREYNVELISCDEAVFRGFFNTKHPVKKVSDLRDLKVRIYEDPVVNLFWKDICNAVSMPYSEVYTGLQTKAIDGLEFADSSVVSSKYYELGKYFTDINWQWTSGGNICIGKKYWDELPEDLKKIVTECAWEASAFYSTEHEKEVAEAQKILKEKGVEVINLTDAERKEWVDYARSLDEQMRNAVGPETFDAVLKVIKESK